METKQYLKFRLHDLQYGIDTALVQEIFQIPEITPIAEASGDMIGLVNLRGQIVPMMHLDLLQEHSVKSFQLSDYVIILQWEDLQFGMIVQQVNEVIELNAELINSNSFDEAIDKIDSALISGVATLEIGNIILLEPKELIPQIESVLPLIWDAQAQVDLMGASPSSNADQQLKQEVSHQDDELQTSKIISDFYDLYCPNTIPEARAIFRQRADNLRQSDESLKLTTELMPLAVIGFGSEYFGVDLELVRGFTEISNLTPIPCCPNHIIGNMNLRGEIVTLVDIRNVLNLPTHPVKIGSEAVVVQLDDIVAGLPVEQVLEMVYLNSADMTPLSGNVSDISEQYVRGTAFFQEKILKVLDIPKIFTQGRLAVNEEA
ncbi:chemotaxis protein CheW [Coleofasciculus sp. LEGE 07092]|nr:chemotaxis protein CheW [Coleofasciculus sp. LEGE 07081]MBE9149207.1 chemotaxis protein CheW [Coleofasciculus sp. LEGE 07092]